MDEYTEADEALIAAAKAKHRPRWGDWRDHQTVAVNGPGRHYAFCKHPDCDWRSDIYDRQDGPNSIDHIKSLA